MFIVLSFGQVTKVLGSLYSAMFTGLIWSSFFGHLTILLANGYLKSEHSKLCSSFLVSFLMLFDLAAVLISDNLAALSMEFDSMLLIFSCLMENG